MENEESSVPNSNLDDENGANKAANEEFQFSSPNGLMLDHEQASNPNNGYFPASQLESSLNESVVDSFVQSDNIKVPQLESTRISSTCAQGDFESEPDISKVASDFGDSINPMNAGFIQQPQSSSVGDTVEEIDPENKQPSMESSVFDESGPESGNIESVAKNAVEESSSASIGTVPAEIVNGIEAEKGQHTEDESLTLPTQSEEMAKEDKIEEHPSVDTKTELSAQQNDESTKSNAVELVASDAPNEIQEVQEEVVTEVKSTELQAVAQDSEPENRNIPEVNIVDENDKVHVKNFSLENSMESTKTEPLPREEDEVAKSDSEVEQIMNKLPETVTELTSKSGVKVYIVGTAHFSHESQEDVAKTILITRPRVVVVELCVGRLNILRMTEETILEEAKNLNFNKIQTTMKQYGAVQGALYLLFLSTSAHLTRQLGMAPGGEFRRAYNEARNVNGCRIHLGDRPIHVTLHRALAALSVWQKLKLVWHLLLSRSPISAEEVERCKQKDLLEEMLEEMTGEFPSLSRVFVHERDLCLAHSIQIAVADAEEEARAKKFTEPPAVVAVVGMGHVAGMVKHFETVSERDVKQVMDIPSSSSGSRVLVVIVKLSFVGLVAFGCYKLAPKLPFNLPSLRPSFLSR